MTPAGGGRAPRPVRHRPRVRGGTLPPTGMACAPPCSPATGARPRHHPQNPFRRALFTPFD